jgi:hypothetical protein
MNRGELRTEIKNRLAIPSSGDGLITDSVVNTAIQDALNVIATTRDWPWLLTSQQLAFPANIGATELPCDFIRAKELVINGQPVTYVDLNQFLATDQLGYPYVWTTVGNDIKIFPIPGTLLLGTLYYYKAEPELTTDGQSPLMPSFLHQWIVAYGAYLCALRRQDEGRAQVYFAQSNDLLNRMRDDVRRKTGRRIQTSREYSYVNWN